MLHTKLIIFPQMTGGNHLANMVGATFSHSNCVPINELETQYKETKRGRNHHANRLFLEENPVIQKENHIYVAHMEQMLLEIMEKNNPFEPNTPVLMINLQDEKHDLTIRGRHMSYIERTIYNQKFLEKLNLGWEVYTINFKIMYEDYANLREALKGTPFQPDTRFEELHKLWLSNLNL